VPKKENKFKQKERLNVRLSITQIFCEFIRLALLVVNLIHSSIVWCDWASRLPALDDFFLVFYSNFTYSFQFCYFNFDQISLMAMLKLR
jgi:hypothetical protein